MSLKTKIKNDLWRFNYVIPFVKKHQFDEKGKIDMLKHVIHAYKTIKPIKANGKRSVGTDTKELLTKVNIDLETNDRFVYFVDKSKTIAVPGNILSNFTLDYDKIVHGSFETIASACFGIDEYGLESKLVAEGVEILAQRISDALINSSHKNKKNLQNYFSRILTTSAETFEEALQRILFFNQILWQTRHRLNGLGRLDLILADLYDKEVKLGILDYKKASRIIFDFLSALSLYQDYKSDALEGDIGQIIILGGKNPDGSYFENDLTRIFLEEQAHLREPDPKTFLRVSKEMPKDLLRVAVKCLTAKTGSPLFSNDDVIVPSLLAFGVDEEDAYNYCVSACWEPLIVGKSLAQNNIAVYDFFTAFDEVLDEEYSNFEELVKKYIDKNKNKFKEFLDSLNTTKWAKDPLVSMFTEGSAERRVDISNGGSKYKNYGITTVALSNVVDSLLTIRDIIFDEKRYTLKFLNENRKEDFKKSEKIFLELKNHSKYYGHDNHDAIILVNEITESMYEVAKEYKNPLGGTVKFGLSSPGYNILSKHTLGDMSGRKHGTPYNTHISSMDAGYTEVVNFAGKLKYTSQRFNGNVVDFFISPNYIDNNFEKFVIFMYGAIITGFFQMQMNVMDSKTLIDAKKYPDKYKGLIVRVWGFSAFFNDLPESYKDLLIERAIAAEQI